MRVGVLLCYDVKKSIRRHQLDKSLELLHMPNLIVEIDNTILSKLYINKILSASDWFAYQISS